MKKKLALILSIVLVLAAVICVFAFSASADEVPYAEQQANDVWKAATNKVTSVKINGVTANATETPVELSTLANAGFTSGTYTLVEGVLTLDAPVHTLTIGSIVATGDLKVVVNNGDWRGTIRNDSAATDACLIVTSETGHKIVTSDANTLRSKGWLIVYGNVGLNIDRATGQAIVKENASGSVIIAPEVDSVIKSINGYNASNAPAYHPTIEVRGGDLIFAGSAKVSIQNDTATNANTAALLLTNTNTTGSVQVIEDVSLDITTAGLTPIHTFGNGLAGKDAILINTTGTVKMAATAFDCAAWGQNAMIQADTGSIRISNGKLLMSQHIATQAGGAAVAIYANNGGGGTTNYTDGVYVEGSAELVIKQTSVPTTPYVAGIWVNGGVVNVSGDAKLTVQTPATSGSNWAINVKLGAVNVSGNAKVHLTSSDRVIRIDLDNSKSGSNRTGLWNTISDESRAYWTDNGGIHVTGGQVDVISRNSLAFDTIDSIGDRKGTWTENFDFSGGVVLARVGNSSDYIFGAAFDSEDDVSNAAYVANLFRDKSATWSQGYDRSGKISSGYLPAWAYFAKDATYTYYNGISEYADFFGAASNEDAAIVDVTYDANGAATYTYTLPYTTTYKIGNNVAKLSKNTKINSAKPLSIAMSTEAASAPDGYVLFTETDGTVYYIFDDATDAVATTHVAQTGTITYDAATQNVTLNGVIGSYFATNIPGKMAINVSGVNVINGKFEVSKADDSSVTFSGTAEDSLTVNPTVQYGFVSTRDTILAGAFTLNINSTREDALHISGVEHDLTVQDAVVLNVVTTHSAGRAIRSAGDMYVTGGTVNATAPTATINSWNDDSDLFISQAEGCTTMVTATATNGSGTISMTGKTSNIEISGGTLKAYANGTLTGDNSASVSCKAIYVTTGLKISGNANVYAEGKSNLVRVDNGDLTLSGSAVLTAVSTFGAEDFAFAQTLSDGTQNEPATWTGVKRAFLRGTGVQIVHVAKGNLTVSDNASLSSTGANETAIQVQNGNLTINGNGSVSATLPTTYNENGKHTEVSSGDTVEAKGARLSTAFDQNNLAGTNAIRITNGNLVQNGGSLTAQAYIRAIYIDTAGKSASFNGGTANVTAASYSLNSQGNVVVNGGNVTSTSTGGDYAIYARDTVNISAGTVNATAGSKTSRSYAIYAVNAVNISGGDVHAIAGWSAIFADKVGVTVSGALWDDANKTGTRVVAEGTANSIYGKGTTGVAISGGTVVSTVTGEGSIRGSQLAISGGDLTLTAPKLALFSNTNDQANGGDRSLTVTGGKSVLNCTADQAVLCGALSISGDEYDAEAKTGTYFSATSGTYYAINADSVKISGGTVLAKAVTDAAINTNSLTVEGGTVTAISSASGANYAAAVTTKNVNLTGGTLNIVLDKIQAASDITTVGLEIASGATEANFKGGTLNISATNAVSTYRVYGIWTNAVDLIFDGTDVNIDITNVVGKNSYDCGIKVQKAYGIYVKGGSIDVRGTSASRIFRLDDTGTSLEITGGELTGVVGYVVSHVGNTNSNAIVIKEGAKIDVYYATGRNQGGTAINTDGVATDIWMKNAAWTDNNHWLTTDNWEGKDSKVVLTLADQSNIELDLTNRTYPADAEIPMFALSAQNELIILDTTMVEPGKILRVHSKGDLKLNISKDVTVNLGNASTAQPLNANGVLTLEGAGTLNIVSGSAGIYAVDGFSLSGLTVKIDAKDNAIQVKHGDAKIDGATVTIDADLFEGIRVEDGDLYINDSTVTVTAMREAGIHTDAGDYFQTNSNVTVTLHGMDGNAPYNNGLMNGGTLIANGGNITVTGGSLTVNSQNCNTDKFHPVHATGDITFKSTTVLVDAPREEGAVVFAPKTLTIDNSYVKVNSIGNSVLRGDAALVISGNAWDDDAKTGTYVEAVGLNNVICGYGEGLTINGGTVKATATETNALRGSDITINGGDITANAGTSGGIFTNTAPAKITIAGGKVVSTVSGSKALDTIGNVEIKNAAVVELTAANEKATEIDGTLFIGGTSQVTAIANSNSQTSTGSSNTLYVDGKVTITDNANVTVKAPYRNRALCANNGLEISGNAVVNASVNLTQSWGAYAAIVVKNGMVVDGNAVINANAGSENTIHVASGDYVQKGNTTVNAAITHTSGSSNGKAILVENGAFNLESGKVNITTTSSKFGALMAKDANISGGSVSINAVLGGSGTTDSIDTDYAAGIVINAADATKGLKISNDAEVIVKATNSGYVGSAVIINGGVLDVSDEAKFAVYAYGSAASYGAADVNSAAITFYPGTMNVSDNAKVYLYSEFDRGLRFLTRKDMADSWKTASGLRVSGGQLEIYSNGGTIPVGVYGGIDADAKSVIQSTYINYTGGVVLLHSDTSNYMYDSAFSTKPSNYVFVGGAGRGGYGNENSPWDRSGYGTEWAYWGLDESYQYYDPMNINKGVFTTKISDTEWTFEAPSTTSGNVPQYDINGTVLALDAKDRFPTDSNPVVKLTKDAEYSDGLVVVDSTGLVTFLDGTNVTSYNSDMITYDGSLVTFNNVSGVAKVVNCKDNMNVVANGTNTIAGAHRPNVLYAIQGSVTVQNNGSLTVSTNANAAISAPGDVSVTGGTLTLNAASSHAISSTGDITLKDLTISVNNDAAYTNADFVICTDGATSYITFDNVKGYVGGYRSVILLASHVTDGAINFINGTDLEVDGSFYSIFTQKDGEAKINVIDSTLDVTADGVLKDTTSREARAFYAYDDITFNNSTVTITTDGAATAGTIMAMNDGNITIVDSVVDVTDNRERNNDVNGYTLYAGKTVSIDNSQVDLFSTNRQVINSNGLFVTGDSVVNVDGYRNVVYIRGEGITVTDNATLNATTVKNTSSGGGHYDAINANVLNVLKSDLSADGYPVVTGWASSENGINVTTYNQDGGTVTGGIWSTAACNGKALKATNVNISGGVLNLHDYHNATKYGAAEIAGNWLQSGGEVNITTYTGWTVALSFQSNNHQMLLSGDAKMTVTTAQGDAIRFIPATDSASNVSMVVSGSAQLIVPDSNAAIRFSGEYLETSTGNVSLVITDNAYVDLNGRGQVIISDTDLNANQTGSMEVSGNADLIVNSTTTFQGIEWRNHVSNPGEITFTDNAVVTITNKVKNSLQATNAKLTVDGNAQLTASVSAQNTSWGNGAVVQVHDIVIDDDAVVTLTNNNVAAGSPLIGLGIVGSSGSKGTANLNGGTLTVNATNNNTSGAVSANRTYPIWHQHNKEINYAGTDVTLNAYTASVNGGGAAGIYTQNSASGTKFNISSGSLHLNATNDISAMFIIDVNVPGIYISGDAKVTGAADMFFNAYSSSHVLKFSGDPTVDFYAYNGDAIDGTTNIDEGNVEFLPGCHPTDNVYFITTGNAVTGNAPSQIIVLDKNGDGHWLYDEDGKRTYGGATRTGDTEVTIENINENAIHANGQIDVTVKGTNTLAQASNTIYVRNGDVNITGADDNAVLNCNVTGSYAINANYDHNITVKDVEFNVNKGIANDNAAFLIVAEGETAEITFDNVDGTIHGFRSHILLGNGWTTKGAINIVDSNLTMTGSRHLIYSQNGSGSTANINVTDSVLNLTASDYGTIFTNGKGDIVIDNSQIVASAANKQAIYNAYGEIIVKGSESDLTVSAKEQVITGGHSLSIGISTFTMEDGVLEVYTTGGTGAMTNPIQNYNGGKVYVNATRESSVENGIVGKAAVSYVFQSSKENAAFNFNGAEVYAYGGNNGVVHVGHHTAKIEVNDGLLMVYATGANAIRAQQGDINVHGGKVIAEAENFTAIQLQNQQTAEGQPVNHLDITGGEVYVKSLYNTIRTMVDLHPDYKGPMPAEKSDVNVSGGIVVSETNMTDADFEAAQTLDDGDDTWAAASKKKTQVRNLGSNLINANGALNVTGGTVTAGTKDSALGGNECAVYANELNVTGGTLNAYVPTVRHDNAWQTDNESVFNDGKIDQSNLYGTYGIRIGTDINITGGEVNVIARTQGIRANSGDITIKGDAKVNVEVAESAGIIVLSNETLLIDEDAEVNLKAKSAAISSSGKAVEILGGDVVINSDSTTITASAGDVVLGGDAKIDLNTVSGNSIDAQTVGVDLIIKDNAKVDIDITAQKASWAAGIKAYAFEMLGGEVDITVDSAPFTKLDTRILSAIDIQGSAYSNGYANLKDGKIVANVNNNYNDANYTTLKEGKEVKDTGSNRTHGFFLKEVSYINFAGTDVEINLNTQLQNGGSGHITVQNSPTTINISDGELKFNANNDIYALFYHTVNEAQINISGGTITGAAKYFWYASGRMNQVLTVTPDAKIDYYCYSGDSRHLGTYNSFNQTYYNWYVDEGVEYLRGCALDDNSQFVTTANMTVEGAATQIQIMIQEGSKTNTYVLNTDNRFFGGDTPETAKAFYTPYGLLYLNNLAAQSIVSNGNVDIDLKGTNTLVKNGNNALYSTSDVTIGGDGVLEMSGADYVFYILGNEIEIGDKANVKIISTSGNAIHVNTANQKENIDAQSIFTLKDDAKLTIEATEAYSVGEDGKVSYNDNGRGIYVRGSDAIINVLGNSVLDVTATDQALYALGNDFDDTDTTKATINIGENAKVSLDAATALQTNGTISAINVNGNAVVDIDSDRAVTINGADATLNVGGNAKITIADTKGDALNIASSALAPEGVKQIAAMNVTDKASVVTGTAGSCGARISVSAKDADGAVVAGEAAFNVSGEAFVDVTALGQTVYLSATSVGGHAIAKVSDNANVNLTNASTTSQYGSALTVNGKKADVEFTTTGTVNITGKSAGWSGALYVTGSDTNVLIKDAKVNVTNVQSTSFEILNADKKNTFQGELSNAMNIGGGEGEFLICGDAVVNTYAERSGDKYNNRAHGLFLHPNMTLKIADNAEANFSAGGDSKANTGSGIHLKESHIVVTDNGTLRVSAEGTAVAGITFEGKSNLTVNKYGAAFIDGGKDAAGVRGYTKATETVITAKDGARVLFTGAPALNLKTGSFEFSVSEVEAGEDKKSSRATAITVVQREYEDLGYVLLKGHMRNPNTSDLVITSVVIAAIVAAAAAVAIIVIRKKKSQD